MNKNELIEKFNFGNVNSAVNTEEVAILKKDNRTKNSLPYECFCLKTAYREDFIQHLKEIKFDNTYIKKTKERAINAEFHDINYIIEVLSKFFKYLIIEKTALSNNNIDGYKSVFTYKNYIYFEKITQEKHSSYLLEEWKNINVDNIIVLLEERLLHTDYISSIEILLENGYKDLAAYRPYFRTKFKYLIFKVENSKEYNDIIILFNIEYGVIDSLFFNNSLPMKFVLNEYNSYIKEYAMGIDNKIIEFKG